MFKVYNVEDVYVLNGNLESWKKQGLPVETG